MNVYMFRKNDLELGVFIREGYFFLTITVFQSASGLLTQKTSEKNFFHKVVGYSWIHPYVCVFHLEIKQKEGFKGAHSLIDVHII